jgi:large subunit ribosomal protein L35
MPKHKSHKGLAKRVKVTKTGKVRFYSPNSRHLKSNKSGLAIQSYRKARFARDGDAKMYGKLLGRGVLSQEQHKIRRSASADSTPAQKG